MRPAERLRELLTDDIERFDKEAEKHKRIHRRCEMLLISLSAVTTIVAALGLLYPKSPNRIQFAVIALSATSTAIGAWVESRRARELWQHEREVYYALIDTRRQLDFRSALRELTQEEVGKLFEHASAILGSSIATWTNILDRERSVPESSESVE